MRLLLVILGALFLYLPSFAESAQKELSAHGGIAEFDLTVCDDMGIPVEDAQGVAYFWDPTDEHESMNKALSDEKGHLVLSGKTFTDGNYSITKEGYYQTRGRATFEAPDKPFGLLERRRWKPVVRDVVLKKVRNPVPMIKQNMKGLPLPRFKEDCALDLEKMDWVAPDGTGVHPDITLFVDGVFREHYQDLVPTNIVIRCVGKDDRLQVVDADGWSRFRSPYLASDNVLLETEINVSFKPGDQSVLFADVILFRIRTKKDAKGHITTAHYGKIETGIEVSYSRDISGFWIYFNPTPNDRNIEFDPKRNLAPKNSPRRR